MTAGTIERRLLSGSTNGKQIKIAATASAGDTVHTAVTGTTLIDEIWLAATNTTTTAVVVTVQWGGTTSPDDYSYFTIPPRDGWIWLAKGRPLNNGLLVKVFAGTTNVICVEGFVNRITNST